MKRLIIHCKQSPAAYYLPFTAVCSKPDAFTPCRLTYNEAIESTWIEAIVPSSPFVFQDLRLLVGTATQNRPRLTGSPAVPLRLDYNDWYREGCPSAARGRIETTPGRDPGSVVPSLGYGQASRAWSVPRSASRCRLVDSRSAMSTSSPRVPSHVKVYLWVSYAYWGSDASVAVALVSPAIGSRLHTQAPGPLVSPCPLSDQQVSGTFRKCL